MESAVAAIWTLANMLALLWASKAQPHETKITSKAFFLMMIPFSKAWMSHVDSRSHDSVARYRSRLIVWCYLVLWLPLIVLFVADRL